MVPWLRVDGGIGGVGGVGYVGGVGIFDGVDVVSVSLLCLWHLRQVRALPIAIHY